MKDQYIIIVILILIAVLFLYKYQENITSDSSKTLSDEALQNIASVYNNKDMTITNLKVTGTFNMILTGTVVMWSGDINKIPTGWVLCDGMQLG
jgi:uncharacterized ion transporter superfamily protein YfcC